MSGMVKAFVLGLAAAATLMAATGTAAASADARIDPSFGDEGIVYQAGDGLTPALGVAEDSAGRLLVVGNKQDRGTYLLRLLPGGRVDTSFGNRAGAAWYVYKTTTATELAVDRRGRALVVGHVNLGIAGCATVTRFTSQGRLDRSYGFGGGRRGAAMICVGTREHGHAGLAGEAITRTPRGGVLVGGTFSYGAFRQGSAAARLRRDGTLDRQLRGDRRTHAPVNGVVKLVPPRGHFGSFREVKALRDGGFLASGYYRGRFIVARFKHPGGLDQSFGRRGIASFDLDGKSGCECSFGIGMARDRRGRIVIAGFTIPNEESLERRLVVIRLLADGRRDRSFAKEGVARPAIGTHMLPTGIVLQPDGRILIPGEVGDQFGLVRLRPAGGLDRTFFNNGVFATDVFGRPGAALDVLIDHRGRIVAAGGSNEGDFAVMRFLPD